MAATLRFAKGCLFGRITQGGISDSWLAKRISVVMRLRHSWPSRSFSGWRSRAVKSRTRSCGVSGTKLTAIGKRGPWVSWRRYPCRYGSTGDSAVGGGGRWDSSRQCWDGGNGDCRDAAHPEQRIRRSAVRDAPGVPGLLRVGERRAVLPRRGDGIPHLIG